MLYDAEQYNNKAIQRNKVIYTCITGGYDSLVHHTCINFDYDYVCFTDSEQLLKNETRGVWKIKSLRYSALDNTRNARWHKTHPHILFPDYEESFWVDGNYGIKSSYIFSLIKKEDIIRIPIHFSRTCTYQECQAVERLRLDTNEAVEQIMELLNKEKFPRNYGLNETNIIYRKHNNKTVIEMMEVWWDIIEKTSKRDQLSLSFVFWKFGVSPYSIALPNTRKDTGNYFVHRHKNYLKYK